MFSDKITNFTDEIIINTELQKNGIFPGFLCKIYKFLRTFSAYIYSNVVKWKIPFEFLEKKNKDIALLPV